MVIESSEPMLTPVIQIWAARIAGRAHPVPNLGVDDIGQLLLHLFVNLRKSEVFGFILAHQQAAPHPRQRCYLDDSAAGLYLENARLVGNIDVFYCQSIENFGRSRPADAVWHIVVSCNKENGNSGFGEFTDAFGEFPLLRLAGFAAFIGIPAK